MDTDDDDGDGYSEADGDCDDTDAAVNPAQTEVCADHLDNDCDGTSNSCGPVSASLSTAIEYVGEGVGGAVAGAGDVNGDGYDDFVVGGQGLGDHGEGGAYVAFGGPSLAGADLSASVTYTGAGVGHDAGYSVAGAGDVNADGFDDVLIGSYFDDPDGWNWGAAYLILGGSGLTSGSLATAITFSGEGVADEAGVSVAGGGDVDGDGFDDVLVGHDLEVDQFVAIP